MSDTGRDQSEEPKPAKPKPEQIGFSGSAVTLASVGWIGVTIYVILAIKMGKDLPPFSAFSIVMAAIWPLLQGALFCLLVAGVGHGLQILHRIAYRLDHPKT